MNVHEHVYDDCLSLLIFNKRMTHTSTAFKGTLICDLIFRLIRWTVEYITV